MTVVFGVGFVAIGSLLDSSLIRCFAISVFRAIGCCQIRSYWLLLCSRFLVRRSGGWLISPLQKPPRLVFEVRGLG